MGRVILTHVNQVPFAKGEPSEPGQQMRFGHQVVGDAEKGPWIVVNTVEPNKQVPLHSHTADETIYIMDGELTPRFADQGVLPPGTVCGTGTAIFVGANTDYGFTAGPMGVRFLNIRSGKAEVNTAEEYRAEFKRDR